MTRRAVCTWPCAERSDGSSQTNPVEAQKIVNIVKKLVQGHDVLPCDIGIVTPYAAQVRAIKKLLNGNMPTRTRFDAPPAPDSMQALEVSTVDGRSLHSFPFPCP